MPRLDPGIHAVPRDVALEVSRESRRLRHPVDGRVKPGYDEVKVDEETEILPFDLNLMPMGSSPAMTDGTPQHGSMHKWTGMISARTVTDPVPFFSAKAEEPRPSLVPPGKSWMVDLR
jgi:hypothetical protein